MKTDENISVVHLKYGEKESVYSFKRILKELVPELEKEFKDYRIAEYSNSIEMVNVRYYTKLTCINGIANYDTKNLYYDISKLEEIIKFIKQ